jgi:putative Mg2+ transporter-C (MgtC) family protein
MHEPLTTLPIEQAAINLAAAAAISSVIGIERQWHNGLAGLRTNNLVALGAATLIVFSDIVPGEGSPVRIAAQAVSGIGLLGAGLIFREGLSVSGLNTAATLWCSAAVSVLARAGSGDRRCSNIFCRVHKPSAASHSRPHRSAASGHQRA